MENKISALIMIRALTQFSSVKMDRSLENSLKDEETSLNAQSIITLAPGHKKKTLELPKMMNAS